MTNIIRQWKDRAIRIRNDRYVNLTDMAKSAGKQLGHWNALIGTKSYLTTLSASIGIAIDQLVQVNESVGTNEERGTWGHPKVALRFAQWCSDEFAVQVDTWIDELLTTGHVELQPTPAPALTQMEMLAAIAANMVAAERRQIEQEQQLKLQAEALTEIAANKKLAEDELAILPVSDTAAAEIPVRGRINKIVRSYVDRTHTAYHVIWGKLYSELYYRYHFDVKARCKNSGRKPLDEIEADGMLESLFAIASEILV